MNKSCKEGFNNPLLYIFIIFMLSSFSYESYSKNRLLAIVIVSIFFIFLYVFRGLYITTILSLFFIISFTNNIWFYSYRPNDITEIRITEVKSYYGKGNINGRLINLSNLNSEIKEGDRIIAKGEFVENKNISKGYIGDFKIDNYKLMNDDLISRLYNRRKHIFNKIKEKLGNRKAAFITSVAFGYKSELDEYDRELMSNMGISHVISVSGLHLVLVYGVLVKVLGAKLGLITALLYVLFTGSAASAVRAYIMVFIMSYGKIIHRDYNPMAALSLAGLIILIIRPYEVFSLGFTLSFLATLGIILFNKSLNKKLYKLPNVIRSTVAVSISSQIFTLPIVILYFNEASIIFLLANLLVVPLITFIVVIGNILIFIEGIPILFNYCLYLCHYLIRIIDILINKIDNLGINVLYFNYTTAYFYIALLITYYFYRKGFKRFIYYPLILGIYIVMIIYSPIPSIRYYKEGGLLVSYKGDRVLIRTKDIVNEKKLKSISLAENLIKLNGYLTIGNENKLKRQGENYILYTKNNKYMLLVNYEKINTECDIIDFRKGDLEEVKLFNNEVITR